MYRAYPRRYRLITLVCAVLVAVAMPFEYPYTVVFAVAVLVAVAIVAASALSPSSFIALQQDRIARKCVDEHNILVDAFYKSGVFDEDTTPDLASLDWEGPGRFYLLCRQVGKTEAEIRDAVQGSLMAFDAVSADVERISGCEYLITYKMVSDFDVLKEQHVEYSQLVGMVKDGD